MRRLAVTLLLLSLAASPGALAQGVQPAYSRGGFDYYSAPVEPAQTGSVLTQCERQHGKHAEIEKLEKGYRCTVPTPSEPRLSTKLNEEIALADQFPEPRRQKVVDTLIDKYLRLAQCPAGTKALHDGSSFVCTRTFSAKELCPAGSVSPLETGELGCAVSSCPKGFTDLGALTRGAHPGCFRCPKGSYDAKETEAFHGALNGMPGPFTDVFCKATPAAQPGRETPGP